MTMIIIKRLEKRLPSLETYGFGRPALANRARHPTIKRIAKRIIAKYSQIAKYNQAN